MLLHKLIAATAVLPFTWAFYDTVPLVAWSSYENALLNAFSERKHAGFDALDMLRTTSTGAGAGGLEVGCPVDEFDVLVVIEQPGLHATDLKHLPPSSSVPSRLRKARIAAQVPYVRRHEDETISQTIEGLATRCAARTSWLELGGVEEFVGIVTSETEEQRERYVVHLALPEVYGEGAWRRGQMAELEETLNRALTKLESAFPKHLIIYTGSLSPSLFFKRQSSSEDDSESEPDDLPFAFAPSNSTSPTGGILARYQILTPGLILALFIAFFLLFPAVFVAIKALASIESSVRLDAPKGPSQTKKNQ